jgi:hypothetical protein
VQSCADQGDAGGQKEDSFVDKAVDFVDKAVDKVIDVVVDIGASWAETLSKAFPPLPPHRY